MQATLMDIELLAAPLVEAPSYGWLILLVLLVLLIGLMLVWHSLWQNPRLLVWRWKRALARGKSVRALALDIYAYYQRSAAKHAMRLSDQQLSAEQTAFLHQACFGANEINRDEFAHWLNQLKQTADKT